MQKPTPLFYVYLRDACAAPGCPVCRLSRERVGQYQVTILSEFATDPKARTELSNARGYCNAHAWRLLPKSMWLKLSIAIFQQDIVETVLNLLDTRSYTGNARQRARRLRKRLRPTAECPACVDRRAVDDILLCTLLECMVDPDLAPALTRSSGLCLPHFLRALELVQDTDALKALVTFERQKFTELRDELSEYICKNDDLSRDEQSGDEGDVLRRAIGMVSGEPGAQ